MIRIPGPSGFRFNWKITVFSLVCVALFMRLGFWQVDRAGAKAALLAQQEARRQIAPVRLEALPADPADAHLRRVETRGEYDDSRIFLLDNRVLNGVVGFEVLLPFREADSNRWALVNRGFVPMGATREVMPAIPPVESGRQPMAGVAWVREYRDLPPSRVAAERPGATIVQVSDPAVIGDIAGLPFYPHIVRLAEDDANALPRHWPVTVMTPETHRGYAVQWFVMAAVVAAAWIAFSFYGPRNTADG